MTLKSVMHVTQGLHFSVMQKRSSSCRIGNTTWKLRNLPCCASTCNASS
ncbi:unnamed protein product [Amoebophrya sp. A120]|nr:unnamed protein product [Amoebophrya sp. A120]|eukprot:GSA120T00026001001.1